MSDGYQVKTPIYFVIFNRPEHTARVWAMIRALRPARLFIAADGPRTPEEAERCAAARAVTEQVDWECDVQRDYAETNMGVVARIVSGYRWAFAHVDRVIFLEDDGLLDPSFFPFCDALMERYADDPRVMAVTSLNLTGGKTARDRYSYYFSRMNQFVAMGVWRRSFEGFTVELKDWAQHRETDWLEQRVKSELVAIKWRWSFDRILFEPADSQDTRLMYHIIASDGYLVVPKTNLQRNIGFDGSGTHSFGPVRFIGQEATRPLTFPLVHPPEVALNVAADHAVAARYLQQRARSPLVRLIPYPWRRALKRLLGRGQTAPATKESTRP